MHGKCVRMPSQTGSPKTDVFASIHNLLFFTLSRLRERVPEGRVRVPVTLTPPERAAERPPPKPFPERSDTGPFGVADARSPAVTVSFSARRAVRSGSPVMPGPPLDLAADEGRLNESRTFGLQALGAIHEGFPPPGQR